MADNKSTLGHRILTGVGIALCVILVPMLIINCTLLIKGWTNKDEVPSLFGYALYADTDCNYSALLCNE